MGLFDSVWIECPGCHKPMEFQSKALADPCMRRFDLGDAPTPILYSIMNQPEYHVSCGTWVVLIDYKFPPNAEPPRPSPHPQQVRPPENPETHSQGFKWWPSGRAFAYSDLENEF